MATKTRKADTEKLEALARLREWIKPGDTVYTILDHVSSSGMSRAIRLVVPYTREDGTIDHVHPNHAAGVVLGLRHWKRNGREQDALIMGGCGMDMGFSLVYDLSEALYGGFRCDRCHKRPTWQHLRDIGTLTIGHRGVCEVDGCRGALQGGYACLGKGKCPSNYHANHRDFIDCPGTRVHNPDGPDTGARCWRPWFGRHDDAPATWPRLPAIDVGEGQTIPGPLASCIATGDGEDATICPTCNGEGHLPNPEGPERFDLIHSDGYAIRHRWL